MNIESPFSLMRLRTDKYIYQLLVGREGRRHRRQVVAIIMIIKVYFKLLIKMYNSYDYKV